MSESFHHWNYRVTKKKVIGEWAYEIREVHYKAGEITAWTTDAISPWGLTKDELRWDLEHMLEALDRPTLNLDKLEKKLARRAAKVTDPTGTTTTSKKSGRIERLDEIRVVPCPHCKSIARHTDRVGCCSGCKRLFTSMSAFDAHRRVTYCLDPLEVGLEQKLVKSDPGVPAWGFPAGDMTWIKGKED